MKLKNHLPVLIILGLIATWLYQTNSTYMLYTLVLFTAGTYLVKFFWYKRDLTMKDISKFSYIEVCNIWEEANTGEYYMSIYKLHLKIKKHNHRRRVRLTKAQYSYLSDNVNPGDVIKKCSAAESNSETYNEEYGNGVFFYEEKRVNFLELCLRHNDGELDESELVEKSREISL